MTKGVTSGICPVGKYATNNALLSSIMKSDRKILDCYSCNNKTRSSIGEKESNFGFSSSCTRNIAVLSCDLSRLQSQSWRSSWNEISCQRITCVCGENSWLGFIDITTLNQVHHHHLVGSILSIRQSLSNFQSITLLGKKSQFELIRPKIWHYS